MADLDGLIKPGSLQWPLLRGSYWLGCGQNWPVQPRLALLSGVTQAADIGPLRVLFPEARPEVSGTICDKSSWSLVAMLVLFTTSLGLSTAGCGEEGSVEALQGPGMKGILSLSIACGRSTWSCKVLWTGLPRVFIFHTGGSGTESCTGSSPPFQPSRHTMWLLQCRSLHIYNWWRCLQALWLSAPLIMVLIWPLPDRGTCKASSLSHTKVYAQ